MSKIELGPKQSHIWNVLTNPKYDYITEILIGGGGGGSKTFTLCVWAIFLCTTYPGIHFGLGRADIINLKRTTLTSFFEVLHLMSIPKNDVKIQLDPDTKTEIIYFRRSGSKIFLIDLKHYPFRDPEFTKLGGLLLTCAGVDEIGETISKAYEILNSRVGRWKNDEYGIPARILSTCNPVKNRVYHYRYKKRKSQLLPKHIRYIPILAKDNPYIDPSYIPKLENMPPGPTKERLLYGNREYDDVEGKLYEYDRLWDMFTNPIINGRKCIIGDVASTGRDKAIIAVRDGRQIIDIAVFAKCTLDVYIDKVKELAQRHGISMSDTLIDEVGEGKGVVHTLHCKGFVGNSKPLGEVDGQPPNYRYLRDQCYFELQHHYKKINLSAIKQTEYREEIVSDLDAIAEVDFDKLGKRKVISKDDIKQKIGRSPDRGDLISMRCWYELQPKKSFYMQMI